ncbi:phospholipase-like protein [Tanacetum coccineum]
MAFLRSCDYWRFNLSCFQTKILIQVLAHERNDRQPKLQFTDAFRCMTSDLCDSLNSMFADLIQQHDSDEDISQDYLREKELRLCLEDEEMLRCKHEKLIVEENRFRLYEAWRLRLEEENMLQLEEQKKNKRKEFMNSSHGKNSLAKLAPAMRNQLCSSSEKINSKDISRVLHCMDTVWLSDDIERFLGQPGQVKCKFPWNDDYTIDRNFWLKLVCLDPTRKGWLTEELLLQKGLPLFYANGERYTTPWSEVDQVFIPINKMGEHWWLAKFYILSRDVTFYDTGYTYDYDYHDWIDDSTEKYSLFEVNYDGVFHELPLRNSLEIGLTIVEGDPDIKKYMIWQRNLAAYYFRNLSFDNYHEDIQSKLKSHEKLKMDAASITFGEVVAWEKEESLSPLLRTPPLKPRKIGGGCFDVGGSFKGFDWIDEPVGSDDRSLSGKSKDEFSNDVILDDVVSSPATTLSLLLKMKGKIGLSLQE